MSSCTFLRNLTYTSNFCALSPVTMRLKVKRSIIQTTESWLATTVAARGLLYMSASSPNMVPLPRTATLRSLTNTSNSPLAMTYRQSPRSPCLTAAWPALMVDIHISAMIWALFSASRFMKTTLSFITLLIMCTAAWSLSRMAFGGALVLAAPSDAAPPPAPPLTCSALTAARFANCTFRRDLPNSASKSSRSR